MKIISSIVLLLVSTSLVLASSPQSVPKINMTRVGAHVAYLQSAELSQVFSVCNKNLGKLEGELTPTKSNVDAFTNYFEKRAHFDISSIEPGSMLRLVFDSRENNGLYDYANNKLVLVTDLLAFCDSAMHAAYEEMQTKNSVKLATVNSGGLLDVAAETDSSSKVPLDAKSGIFKANSKDRAWHLTNSYDRIVTYETMNESGPKMIVLVKIPGKEYRLGSELPEGYYQLHGRYPFDVKTQGDVTEKNILVFEQVSVIDQVNNH